MQTVYNRKFDRTHAVAAVTESPRNHSASRCETETDEQRHRLGNLAQALTGHVQDRAAS